jgi:UDP-N-acetylmuramoylalanine--D-glutamate ligase
MAAAAAALSLGVDPEAVSEGLASFEGVPHRLERVRELRGVTYVNDSKATNVTSALAGLKAFEGVHLILGGSLKGESFERLAGPVSERCSACYLIGEASDRLERDLAPAAAHGVPVRRSADLERAVSEAAGAVVAGEVVLLSPACASFDHYESFEARGEHFRSLVEALR